MRGSLAPLAVAWVCMPGGVKAIVGSEALVGWEWRDAGRRSSKKLEKCEKGDTTRKGGS